MFAHGRALVRTLIERVPISRKCYTDFAKQIFFTVSIFFFFAVSLMILRAILKMNNRCPLVVRIFRDIEAPVLTAALLAGRQIDSWPRQVPFMFCSALFYLSHTCQPFFF